MLASCFGAGSGSLCLYLDWNQPRMATVKMVITLRPHCYEWGVQMSAKQRLFLLVEMCLGMGTVMGLVGNFLAMGITVAAWHTFLAWWFPTVVVSFGYALLVVNRLVNWLIKRHTVRLSGTVLQHRSNQIRSWTMLIVMCVTMCTWGLVTAGAIPGMPVVVILVVWVRSLLLAYVVRGLIIQPLAMRIMQRVVPE